MHNKNGNGSKGQGINDGHGKGTSIGQSPMTGEKKEVKEEVKEKTQK